MSSFPAPHGAWHRVCPPHFLSWRGIAVLFVFTPKISRPDYPWTPTDQVFFPPETSHLNDTNIVVCFRPVPPKDNERVVTRGSLTFRPRGDWQEATAASRGRPREAGRVPQKRSAQDSLHRTSSFPQLDVICLNADISPAKVHAASSDVGHILMII